MTDEVNNEIIKLFNPCTQMYLNHVAENGNKSPIDALKDLIHDRLLPYYGYQLHDRIQNRIVYSLRGAYFNPSLDDGCKVSISDNPYAPYDIKISKSRWDVLNVEVKTSIQTAECRPTFPYNLRRAIAKYFEMRIQGPTLLIQYQKIIDAADHHLKTERFYELSELNEEDFQKEVIHNNKTAFWSAAYIHTHEEGDYFEVYVAPHIKQDGSAFDLDGIIGKLIEWGRDDFLYYKVWEEWPKVGAWVTDLFRDKPDDFNELFQNLEETHYHLKKKLKYGEPECCEKCGEADKYIVRSWYCNVKKRIMNVQDCT